MNRMYKLAPQADFETSLTVTYERRVTYHWKSLTEAEKKEWYRVYRLGLKKRKQDNEHAIEQAWKATIATRKLGK